MEHNWIDIIKKVLDEERINSSDFDLNHNIVLPSDRKLIALDELGRHMTSRELASLVQNNLDQGVQNLCFVIGGADGLSETVLELADDKICLGKMTWPHQLVRVMLIEQLWRCVSILTNHPYHRD